MRSRDRVLTAAAAYFACEQIATHCQVSRRMSNTELVFATIIIYDVFGLDKRNTQQILMLWHLFLFHCRATNTGLVDVLFVIVSVVSGSNALCFISFARQTYSIEEVFPMERIYGIISVD